MLSKDEITALSDDERAAYQAGSFNDRIIFANALREGRAIREEMATPAKEHSAMRFYGRVGAVGFFLIAVVAAVLEFDRPYGGGPAWVYFWSGLCSLSMFMWMLGAIEHRLIEINETLKRQG